jgi:hypothetical protein
MNELSNLIDKPEINPKKDKGFFESFKQWLKPNFKGVSRKKALSLILGLGLTLGPSSFLAIPCLDTYNEVKSLQKERNNRIYIPELEAKKILTENFNRYGIPKEDIQNTNIVFGMDPNSNAQAKYMGNNVLKIRDIPSQKNITLKSYLDSIMGEIIHEVGHKVRENSSRKTKILQNEYLLSGYKKGLPAIFDLFWDKKNFTEYKKNSPLFKSKTPALYYSSYQDLKEFMEEKRNLDEVFALFYAQFYTEKSNHQEDICNKLFKKNTAPIFNSKSKDSITIEDFKIKQFKGGYLDLFKINILPSLRWIKEISLKSNPDRGYPYSLKNYSKKIFAQYLDYGKVSEKEKQKVLNSFDAFKVY